MQDNTAAGRLARALGTKIKSSSALATTFKLPAQLSCYLLFKENIFMAF